MTINECSILNSDLTNAAFFDTLNRFDIADKKTKSTAVITKPLAVILVNPQARGISTPKAFMKLDQSAGMIPLRVALQPQKVKTEDVNKETEANLKKIGPYDRNASPIPQRLIKEIADNPEKNLNSMKILKKAALLAAEVDSFFLPGGEDIPPALYGQEKEAQTEDGGDYRRSLLELGLIHHAFNKGIPIMGVCRGFQMSNVYFGAQLIQHVDGHKGVQMFKLEVGEAKGLYFSAFKNNLIGASVHHQAIPKQINATEHLETAVEYENLIKAVEPKEGGSSPMILLQFHPEFYKATTADDMEREFIDAGTNLLLSKNNDLFFEILSDSANTYRNKKNVLSEIKKRGIGEPNL